MAVIEFRTLGTLDLRRTDGTELHSLLAQPKRVALLAYLCLASPRSFHRRDTLLGLFWPDADQAHARASLRNALHVLRHSLGETVLQSRGDEEITVNLDVIWCDAVAFDDRIVSEDVDGALELYRGDLLTGFFLDETPAFERWLAGERTRLRTTAASAARLAAERREAEHQHTDAVKLARRAVELADTDERAVRALMQLLARLGDRAGALHAYQSFEQQLAAEFDAEPSAETRALVERLRSEEPWRGVAEPEKSISPPPADRLSAVAAFPRVRGTSAMPVAHARIWRAVAVAVVIGVALLALWRTRGSAAADKAGARLGDRTLVTNSGDVASPAISPSGKTIAYVGMRCKTADCPYRLELKEVDGSANRVILDGLGALERPALQWSPDGSKIMVYGNVQGRHGQFLISPLGGAPRRINQNRSAFWRGGDSLIFARTESPGAHWIMISGTDGVIRDSIAINRTGEAIEYLVPIPNSDWIAVALRRGPRFHWLSINRNGKIADSLPHRARTAPRASIDALWLGPIRLSPERSIVRIPFDARSGRFGIREDTMQTRNSRTEFDVTPDGTTLVFDEERSEFTGWAMEMRDAIRGKIPDKGQSLTATADLELEISPDGKRILIGRGAGPGTRNADRYDIMPFPDGPMMPLSSTPAGFSAVIWSDSTTIPVAAQAENGTKLALLDVKTGTLSSVFVAPDSSIVEAVPFPTGGWAWLPVGERVIKLHRRGEGVRAIPYPKEWLNVRSLAVSRDGKKLLIAGYKLESVDSLSLGVISVSDGVLRHIRTTHGGAAPVAVWLPDGSIMLTVWSNPDGAPTLYQLRESGKLIWTARIPLPIWTISFSDDLKFAALTLRYYHGDALISRVLRN
jgi:DNA-binding SARP family transcriptional activator